MAKVTRVRSDTALQGTSSSTCRARVLKQQDSVVDQPDTEIDENFSEQITLSRSIPDGADAGGSEYFYLHRVLRSLPNIH